MTDSLKPLTSLLPGERPMRDRQHFLPGHPTSAGSARRITAVALGSHPLVSVAELVVSELVTNALRHTRSGGPGGEIGVTIECDGETVRLEVVDNGTKAGGSDGPMVLPRDSTREHGLGLVLIDSLAHAWGITDHPNGYRSVWVLLSEDAKGSQSEATSSIGK